MQRDRFLTGILVGIAALIVLALALFFLRRGTDRYMDEATPAGVINNYVLALQEQEYERAYGYLADSPSKPDLAQFQQSFLGGQQQAVSRTAVDIGDIATANGDQTATVQLVLLETSGGLFSETRRSSQTATLVKQEGQWKIASGPYPIWSFYYD